MRVDSRPNSMYTPQTKQNQNQNPTKKVAFEGVQKMVTTKGNPLKNFLKFFIKSPGFEHVQDAKGNINKILNNVIFGEKLPICIEIGNSFQIAMEKVPKKGANQEDKISNIKSIIAGKGNTIEEKINFAFYNGNKKSFTTDVDFNVLDHQGDIIQDPNNSNVREFHKMLIKISKASKKKEIKIFTDIVKPQDVKFTNEKAKVINLFSGNNQAG